MEKIVQEGWSMVRYSNGTIFEMFSTVIHITVHTSLFKFHCKQVISLFFQFGARREGYKTEGWSQFWFGLFESGLSVILVSKLSQFCVNFQS